MLAPSRWSLRAVVLLALVPAGAPAQERAALPPGIALGVVVDPSGEPVAGARVTLLGRADPCAPPASRRELLVEVGTTETDARGRFSLALPYRDLFAIEAGIEGIARSKLMAPVIPGSPTTLRLRTLRELRGTVTDADGEPVPGAALVALDPPEETVPALGRQLGMLVSAPRHATYTDAAGQFVIHTALPAGARLAVATGHGSVMCELPEGPVCDIRLEAERRLLLTFLDPDGEPLPGVQLDVPFQPLLAASWATSDADGELDAHLLGTESLVRVRTADHATIGLLIQQFPRRLGKEITLRPETWLRCRLVDRGGRPLPDRRILLAGEVELVPLPGPEPSSARVPLDHQTRTDAEGYVDLPESMVADDGSALWIETGTQRWVLAARAATAEQLRGAELRVPRTSTIEGTVLDPDGVPRAGVGVLLQPLLDDDSYYFDLDPMTRVTVTDSAGRFRFADAETGRHEVSTLDAEFLRSGRPVEVPEEGDGNPIVVEIRSRRGPIVEGRVVDSQGRGVPGAYVSVSSTSSEPDPDRPRNDMPVSVRADAEGRFRVPMEAGSVEVSASAWTMDGSHGWLDDTLDVAAGGPLEIVVR